MQKYYVWQHENGDYTVRTTSYSLPAHLHAHVDVIQPTTMFAQWKGMKSTLFYEDGKEEESSIVANTALPIINAATGVSVDPACNVSITVSCLKQLYNAVGYVPKATKKNSIAATGYLEQNANIADLQQFYADQVPEAVGTNFTFISVKGTCLLSFSLSLLIHSLQAVSMIRTSPSPVVKPIWTPNSRSGSHSLRQEHTTLQLGARLSSRTTARPLTRMNHTSM